MTINKFDETYHNLLKDIKENGRFKMDRTGTGCYSVFGRQVRFDLSKGEFPLITTKKVFMKGIIHELLWFLKGDTNNNSLRFHDVHIWDEWAYEDTPEVTAKKYAWLMKNAPEYHARAKITMNTIVGVHGDGETRREREAYGIDTIYRDAGGPEISPEHGELGPVYGAMWRAWPDIIEISDEDRGEAAQYELLGDVYGGGLLYNRKIDQMQILIDNLKKNPFSRRHIISGWNPALLPEEGVSHHDNIENGKQALPPCHTMFQFFVEEMTTKERIEWIRRNKSLEAEITDAFLKEEVAAGKFMREDDDESIDALVARNYELYAAIPAPKYRLSCQLYQRSADVFLGVPFNIASYALLTMMVAQAVDMVPGEFIHTFGDLHIYSNHLEQVDLQLSRESYAPPKVRLNPDVKSLFDFEYGDIELVDYQSHPAIKAKVAV